MKIIINGAGRIGRCLIRRIVSIDKINLFQINDPYLNAENLAYLLKYDSIYWKINHTIKVKKNILFIGKKKILFSRELNFLDKKFPNDLSMLIDASGIKENHIKISNLKNKKFISLVTHTFDKADFHIIFGINENKLNLKKHKLISTSICDAVAIGPIINLIKKKFGFSSGSILTLHPWLAYQNLVDGPSRSFAYPGEIIENFSLGRSSTEALISKKTSCLSALDMVMPKLSNEITAMSFRVPTPIVSSAYIQLNLKKKTTTKKILLEIDNFIKKQKFKIITNNKDQCISKDFIANEYSTIIDERWIEVKNNNLRLLVWYDNEFGYSSRVVDLIKKIKNNEKI